MHHSSEHLGGRPRRVRCARANLGGARPNLGGACPRVRRAPSKLHVHSKLLVSRTSRGRRRIDSSPRTKMQSRQLDRYAATFMAHARHSRAYSRCVAQSGRRLTSSRERLRKRGRLFREPSGRAGKEDRGISQQNRQHLFARCQDYAANSPSRSRRWAARTRRCVTPAPNSVRRPVCWAIGAAGCGTCDR